MPRLKEATLRLPLAIEPIGCQYVSFLQRLGGTMSTQAAEH
jgi:hypothetical protein